MVLDLFFNLLIYPLKQVIEFSFSLFFHVFKNPGAAILGVSLAVTILCLPLYIVAEKWTDFERDIQKKLEPGVKRIKKFFKGDEQYMILTTFYRQNHYHPIMALRSSFSLLIQIPFFLAAYSYLSHLSILQGHSFFILKDLGKSDALFTIGSFTVNVLPILMTLINCASGFVYTKGHSLREKLQVYIMAALFLVVLYDSPSGLVLYWTLNQVFSLTKNIFMKLKNPLKVFFCCVAAAILFCDFYLIFMHPGSFKRRILMAVVISFVLLAPIFVKAVSRLIDRVLFPLLNDSKSRGILFFSSAIGLFLLTGLFIPSSIISSSVIEFFNIDNLGSPVCFVRNTLVQSCGLFLVWPTFLYFLFNKRIQTAFSGLSFALFAGALINTFIFVGHYGTLTRMLTFSENIAGRVPYSVIIVNLVAIAVLIVAAAFAIKYKFSSILQVISGICCISLFAAGIFYTKSIKADYEKIASTYNPENAEEVKPVLHLSKDKQNVVLFMLDRSESAYLSSILEEDPSLKDIFTGFTYYPNTISYGGHTIIGAPPLFGGYEYTPEEFNKRSDVSKLTKNNEALKVLPKIFGEELGYNVTITDTSWANYQWIPDMSIFQGMKNVTPLSLEHTYTGLWMDLNKDKIRPNLVSSSIRRNMLWVCFFRISPAIFRDAIYDDSKWWSTDEESGDIQEFIDYYSALYFLPQLTDFESDKPAFLNITNDSTHSGFELNPPDYVPATKITGKGVGKYAKLSGYSANVASFKLIGKWIELLKQNGVYDNTKIIIAADHGIGQRKIVQDLYNGTLEDGFVMDHLNPMLLVKDFGAEGEIKTDTSFMTNADVPLLLLRGLVENPVNPFTGKQMNDSIKKEKGAVVTTNSTWSPDQHSSNTFSIKDDEWYTVKDNIFDIANWKKGK